MKTISFIEEKSIIEKILRHCRIVEVILGNPRRRPPRPPPPKILGPPVTAGPCLDYALLSLPFLERVGEKNRHLISGYKNLAIVYYHNIHLIYGY